MKARRAGISYQTFTPAFSTMVNKLLSALLGTGCLALAVVAATTNPAMACEGGAGDYYPQAGTPGSVTIGSFGRCDKELSWKNGDTFPLNSSNPQLRSELEALPRQQVYDLPAMPGCFGIVYSGQDLSAQIKYIHGETGKWQENTFKGFFTPGGGMGGSDMPIVLHVCPPK